MEGDNMINWKVRLKHKPYLVSLISLILVLANQIANLLGYDITVINEQITEISETILTILVVLGVIIDPTTKGIADSERALTYKKPKE